MPARLSAFVVWALVAAGLVFWGYRLWASPLGAPAHVQPVAEGGGLRGDLTRLLGVAAAPITVAAAPVAESNRFRLLGVLAPMAGINTARPSTAGVALIAVDGKPARPFAVGARVDNELVLLSIARRSASIGPAQGSPSLVLELPPPVAPATGSLPRAMADGEPARPMGPIALPGASAAMAQAQRPPVQAPLQVQAQPAEDVDEDDEEPVAPPQRRAVPGTPTTR